MHSSYIWKSLLSFTLFILPIRESVARTTSIDWFIAGPTSDTYKGFTAEVGDKVTFEWTEAVGHNVFVHPTGDCEQDGRVSVGENFEGTSYTFTAADVGDLTFACDIPGHCLGGQIITFAVTDAPMAEATVEAEVEVETEVEDPSEPIDMVEDDSGAWAFNGSVIQLLFGTAVLALFN